MADTNPIQPNGSSGPANDLLGSLVDHVMMPGSTFDSPTFLVIVDITLLSLLFLFAALLVLTRSLHFLALGIITLGLWGSVKWYVEELRRDNELRFGDAQPATTLDNPVDHPTKAKTTEGTW